MIRSVFALFVFSILICSVIIFRPFSGDDTAQRGDRLGVPLEQIEQQDVQVTRSSTPNADALLAQAALADVADPVDAVEAVAAVVPAVVQAPQRIDVDRPDTDDTSLNDMTQNVLAELGFVGVEPVVTAGEEQLRTTASILEGIEATTGQNVQVTQRQTLEDIVVAALRAGTSDSDIDTLVNDAAASGAVAVPEILVTSEGRVDTHVLLTNIVVEAQIAAGNGIPMPITTPDNTDGLEVRVVQRATETIQARFYTVQPGDSLGAIAITFYGRSDQYDLIYFANRHILSSPDRIRIGQRLVIPQI